MTGAATMTYDSLVADIIAYAERSSDTSFIDRVPRFIALCENRLAVEVRGLGILQTVTGTLASAVMDKPVRWRETRNFSILVGAERRFIFERSYEYCRAFWPDSSLTAEPRYYADYDYEHFLLVGTPDQAYPFELQYFERPEPLSSSNQTNWTTRYAPQLLLYGSLLEAQPYLKTSERIQEFQNLFDRSLMMVTREDQRRLAGDASARKE